MHADIVTTLEISLNLQFFTVHAPQNSSSEWFTFGKMQYPFAVLNLRPSAPHGSVSGAFG